jgi:hypothetical protein
MAVLQLIGEYMTISPDTIQKLSDLWENCPADLQASLIKKYLDQLKSGRSEDWAVYLANEFCASQVVRLKDLFHH